MANNINFREAQLLVYGACLHKGMQVDRVILNNLQKFHIGDVVEVVEIPLDKPCIVIECVECVQSYVYIKYLSDKVVDECIDILREYAKYIDMEG